LDTSKADIRTLIASFVLSDFCECFQRSIGEKSRKNGKTEKSKGTHFPFPLSYDPPIEGHRQACPAKFISDSYCRSNCSAFEQMGGQMSQLPGSNFLEVFERLPYFAHFLRR
jgi:hypothetical protein